MDYEKRKEIEVVYEIYGTEAPPLPKDGNFRTLHDKEFGVVTWK
jgi:hypothetical protein